MRLFTMRSRICPGSELIASSAMFSYSSTSMFVPLVSVFPWKAVFRSVISRVEGPCRTQDWWSATTRKKESAE